jgi:hypothetical protein
MLRHVGKEEAKLQQQPVPVGIISPLRYRTAAIHKEGSDECGVGSASQRRLG